MPMFLPFNLFFPSSSNSQTGNPQPLPRKVRIKKRFRPLSQRRTPDRVIEDWLAGIGTWLECMLDLERGVYLREFPAAMWGEMGEYGIRGSTFFGIVFAILGFVSLFNLPGAVFLIKGKFFVNVAMIVIGLYQLRDLNGPIWWADRWAVAQVDKYDHGEEVEHYERYSEAMARLRPNRNMPLTLSEIRRVAELYHQFCTNTLSERSWREIGEYTQTEMEFFYNVAHLEPRDPRFPEDALKPETAQS